MGIFRAIDTSASGLSAERLRMDVISNNIANVNTLRTEDGGPFRRRMALFQSRGKAGIGPFDHDVPQRQCGEGVRVLAIQEDQSPLKLEYDPSHPEADENGYVQRPNVDIVHEMVDMITATRAYEANVTCINSAKDMLNAALGIGKR